MNSERRWEYTDRIKPKYTELNLSKSLLGYHRTFTNFHTFETGSRLLEAGDHPPDQWHILNFTSKGFWLHKDMLMLQNHNIVKRRRKLIFSVNQKEAGGSVLQACSKSAVTVRSSCVRSMWARK